MRYWGYNHAIASIVSRRSVVASDVDEIHVFAAGVVMSHVVHGKSVIVELGVPDLRYDTNSVVLITKSTGSQISDLGLTLLGHSSHHKFL